MLSMEAQKLGFRVVILDPSASCPASSVCHHQILGQLSDYDCLVKLNKMCDILTFEIEHIDCQVLTKLQQNTGAIIYPSTQTLDLIKDKLTQKQFLKDNNLPVGRFVAINNLQDVLEVATIFGYPFVLKTRFGGYDGKGNFVIKSEADCQIGFETLGKNSLYAEEFVPFILELSVIVVKGTTINQSDKNNNAELRTDIKTYPVVETHQTNSVCSLTFAPANISSDLQEKAKQIAYQTLSKLDATGVFAVEMFLQTDDQILINEIAPRVHNSGHWTMEGCITSQFANHIRAITSLPLGSVTMIVPTVGMLNILGDNYDIIDTNLAQTLEIDSANTSIYVHNYQKLEARLGRKMGHINILGQNKQELEYAIKRIQKIDNKS